MATAKGIPRLKERSGPAVLSYGFRPFFLGAALWSAAAMIAWLFSLVGTLEIPTAFDPLSWHIHEMLFGFAAAVVAGFLLTAIPNWTGRLPLQGGPLLGLVALWLAGRIAIASSAVIGAWIAAAIDLAFLATFFFVVTREIVIGNNWRNLPMVAALALLVAANALFHLQALGVVGGAGSAERLAIAVLVALITLIGGRILPSFTRNWLVKQGETRVPAEFSRFDQLTLAATIAAMVAWVLAATGTATAPLAAAAAALNLFRLARWQGTRTLRQPLLSVLHVAYLWIPVGLALLALAAALPAVPATAAVHALTAGAIGTMTLAVMTRATLGHTGRDLHAGPATSGIYALVLVAAVARVWAAFAASTDPALLVAAGALWTAAFLLFVVMYGPLLVTSRRRPLSSL
jgi:uncharacterized protein involved in response to NO